MYRYKAINEMNQVVVGEIAAASEQEAFAQLDRRGLFPIEAVTRGPSAALSGTLSLSLSRGISPKDIMFFTRQLSALLGARLELERAFDILTGLTTKPQLKQVLADVRDEIRNGAGLADALERQFTALPAYYVGMIRAGEAGGTLESTCARLAHFLKRQHDAREAVLSQLIYPVILVITASLSIVLLVTIVLPQFEPIFRDAGRELPFLAGLLLDIGNVVGDFWWVFAGALIAGAVLYRHYGHRPAVRAKRDALLLQAPLIGPLLLRTAISRYCRTLGTLLENGVPASQALASAVSTTGNSAVSASLSDVTRRVREGTSIADGLASAECVPDLARQLVRIGEESGRLDQMLLQAADLYDQEVERRIRRLVSTLTPALTIVLGILVAGIISSILMAILSINDIAF